MYFDKSVEKWSVWEYSCEGPQKGNPFVEQEITGVITNPCEQCHITGFYDGQGKYRLRFMPAYEGKYSFVIHTSFGVNTEGSFTVTAASQGNHGPVHVANQYHFAYADGTPYYCIGTTCYVWTLQDDDMIQSTLETLKKSAFNKIRFCVFPKHYAYNLYEPRTYPYEGTPMDSSVLTTENFWSYSGKKEGNQWDFTRFRPDHFQHLEVCIRELQQLGIEADLILFHPYDRWGFSSMTPEQDAFYLRYVMARLAAFRNVWWSLANEYDLIPSKSIADWEAIAHTICENDPYQHLRSIHNCAAFYDHSRPWITHCSIQRQDLYRTAENVNIWRERYGKPVVLDEIAYEGSIQYGWGNLTAQEMVRRFWEGALRGGYPGHGETIFNPSGKLWWSHGGKLYGESAPRFRFLLDILKETPGLGLAPLSREFDETCAIPDEITLRNCQVRCYYLCYYSFMRPSFRDFYFDDTTDFQVTVLDTWNMTRENQGIHHGHFRVDLPGRQYMAIQLKKIDN